MKTDHEFSGEAHSVLIDFCKDEIISMAIDRINKKVPVMPTLFMFENINGSIVVPETCIILPDSPSMSLIKDLVEDFDGELAATFLVYMGEYTETMEIADGDLSIFMPKLETDVARSHVEDGHSNERSDKTIVGLLEFDGENYTLLSSLSTTGLPGS